MKEDTAVSLLAEDVFAKKTSPYKLVVVTPDEEPEQPPVSTITPSPEPLTQDELSYPEYIERKSAPRSPLLNHSQSNGTHSRVRESTPQHEPPRTQPMEYATPTRSAPQPQPESMYYPSPNHPAASSPYPSQHFQSPATGGYYPGYQDMSASPMLQSQLMQIQQQISMVSQLALANQSQNYSGNNNSNSSRDSVLCFTLGERLGALHKHEEVTQEALNTLQSNVEDITRNVFDLRSRQGQLETSMHQQEQQRKQSISIQDTLQEALQEQRNQLTSIGSHVSHQEKSMKLFRQNQESQIAKVSTLIQEHVKQLEDLGKTVIHLQHSSEGLLSAQQENKAQLASAFGELRSCAVRLQAMELRLDHEKETLKKHQKEATDAIKSQQEFFTKEMRAVEKRHQDALKHQMESMQHQLQSLQAELSRMAPTLTQLLTGAAGVGGAGVSPYTMFLLQALLPFLSPERIQQVGSLLAKAYGSVQLLPHIRNFWYMVVAVDLGLRILERFAPWVLSLLRMGLAFSPPTGKVQTLFRILRISFELAVVAQIAVRVWEASIKLGQNLKKWAQDKQIEWSESSWQRRACILLASGLIFGGIGTAGFSYGYYHFSVRSAKENFLPYPSYLGFWKQMLDRSHFKVLCEKTIDGTVHQTVKWTHDLQGTVRESSLTSSVSNLLNSLCSGNAPSAFSLSPIM